MWYRLLINVNNHLWNIYLILIGNFGDPVLKSILIHLFRFAWLGDLLVCFSFILHEYFVIFLIITQVHVYWIDVFIYMHVALREFFKTNVNDYVSEFSLQESKTNDLLHKVQILTSVATHTIENQEFTVPSSRFNIVTTHDKSEEFFDTSETFLEDQTESSCTAEIFSQVLELVHRSFYTWRNGLGGLGNQTIRIRVKWMVIWYW